jgi:hypothetical protein
MLAFTFESELLPNELVGFALLILDVIRCFYVLDLALCPTLNCLMDDDGAPVVAIYIGERLDPQKKNLDLKSGETTR